MRFLLVPFFGTCHSTPLHRTTQLYHSVTTQLLDLNFIRSVVPRHTPFLTGRVLWKFLRFLFVFLGYLFRPSQYFSFRAKQLSVTLQKSNYLRNAWWHSLTLFGILAVMMLVLNSEFIFISSQSTAIHLLC